MERKNRQIGEKVYVLQKEKERSQSMGQERQKACHRLSDHRFEEVMLVRDDDDLREFKEMYGIEEDPEIIY